MQGTYDDAWPWSPRRGSDVSYFSSSSHPSDADDELDDKMSQADTVEREEFAGDGGSGRNSSSLSVYSYHSSVDGSAILRDIHGRTFNNTSDNYMLPADVAEHDRLDLQHEMLKKKRGGLFFAPQAVRRALAPRDGSRPSILDVGSGSGSWVIEMGRQFPHAEVVGLDLAPANLRSYRTPPSNCRFECDDANLGLLHYKGCFDVVNASCVSLGITNYRKFMDEVVEILRPGGVFLTVEGDMQIYDENYNPVSLANEGEPGFTYTVRLIYDWLQDQGNVWRDIGQKFLYIHIGPWEDGMSAKDKQISELMRQDLLRLFQSAKPLLLSYGWFEETVDKWSAGAEEEFKILKNKYYVRWLSRWAIKPGQTT